MRSCRQRTDPNVILRTFHFPLSTFQLSTYFKLSTLSFELSMDVYLIDGTYELFRHFYAVPPAHDRDGREVGAVRGVLRSLLGMMTVNTTHIGVATDHVIES